MQPDIIFVGQKSPGLNGWEFQETHPQRVNVANTI
jgi:hypothetical protein